jgi:hypothetical protein
MSTRAGCFREDGHRTRQHRILRGGPTGRVSRSTREAVQIAIRIAEDVSPTLRAAWREVQLRNARARGRISHLHRERLQVGSGSLGHCQFPFSASILQNAGYSAWCPGYLTAVPNNVKTEKKGAKICVTNDSNDCFTIIYLLRIHGTIASVSVATKRNERLFGRSSFFKRNKTDSRLRKAKIFFK